MGKWSHRLLLPVALAGVLAACGGDDTPPAGDGGGGDAGPMDAATGEGGPGDAGGGDATMDDGGGTSCEFGCGMFEHCDEGTCRSYPGCVSMEMCDDGEICRHRFCIPVDDDPDGDGVPAGMDCDETDPDVYPGAPEACNGEDEDCDEMIDEGDPAMLCAMDPSGGECMDGSCGCPRGEFDIDDDPSNGCECMAEPPMDQGLSCTEPIDVGDLSDTGQTVTVTGNVLPDDREVWYRFRAVDAADDTCDNFHVRVRFTDNPGDVFGLEVFRGACDADAECMGTDLFDDYEWFTDLDDGMGTGECPCTDMPEGMPGATVCNDDTGEYFVRVVRRPGSMVTCDGYTLELTNGVYDAP